MPNVLIWINDRFWVGGPPTPQSSNTSYISPWTGKVWARIERRSTLKWWPQIVPEEGEEPYPYPEVVPGSLLCPGDAETLLELPRELLHRELALLKRLTTFQPPCDNLSVIGDRSMNQSLLQEIAALRAAEAAGTLTDEQLRRAIQILRESRMSAAARTAAKVDPDQALSDFLGS